MLGILVRGSLDQPRREKRSRHGDQDLWATHADGVGNQSPNHDGDRRHDGKGANRVEETATPRGHQAENSPHSDGTYDDRDRRLHRADLPHSGRFWPC